MIRTAQADDLRALRDVERAAGEAFRSQGMAVVADDEPLSLPALGVVQQAGRAWVATDPADRPVGYLLVSVVDAAAHVDQVSVHPSHARPGIGAALLETAGAWARERRSGP